MSTSIRTFTAGLTGLGLAWFAMHAVADAAQDAAQAAPSAAPSAPPAARVLLMSNGRVVEGTVLETDEGYTVGTPFGEMPFRRRDVVRTFASIAEVYEYKKAETPERDPDEHMKLAQWCISHSLYAQALEQVDQVLVLSPDLAQAKSMKFMLRSKAAGGPAMRDEAVGRTSLSNPAADVPATISPNVLRELRDQYRRSPDSDGLPVIFDLPRPLAVRRYREFAAFVHPALQNNCAKCHNEQSNSRFHLVEARTRRDMENDLVIRANLDAVLPLIDPANPASSRLLSSAIMPHPPNNRPVLAGPNSSIYRQLSTWVLSLHSATAAARPPAAPAAPSAAPSPTLATAAPVAPGGGFAADRLAGSPAVAPAAAPPPDPVASPAPTTTVEPPHTMLLPTGETAAIEPTPAGQLLPGSQTAEPQAVPPPSEFPTSPLLGGPNPEPIPIRGVPPTADGAVTKTTAPAAAKGKTIRLPNGLEIPVVDTREPGAAAPAADSRTAPPASGATTPDARPRPVRIDPKKLQSFISGRTAPATP